VILLDEMCRDLDALVVAKNGGIPVDMSRIFATIQGARAWYRSPVRISHLRL